jgi:hypothetical protein
MLDLRERLREAVSSHIVCADVKQVKMALLVAVNRPLVLQIDMSSGSGLKRVQNNLASIAAVREHDLLSRGDAGFTQDVAEPQETDASGHEVDELGLSCACGKAITKVTKDA